MQKPHHAVEPVLLETLCHQEQTINAGNSKFTLSLLFFQGLPFTNATTNPMQRSGWPPGDSLNIALFMKVLATSISETAVHRDYTVSISIENGRLIMGGTIVYVAIDAQGTPTAVRTVRASNDSERQLQADIVRLRSFVRSAFP